LCLLIKQSNLVEAFCKLQEILTQTKKLDCLKYKNILYFILEKPILVETLCLIAVDTN